MIEWLLLAVGMAGFGIAGYLDLKTTEFPDWIPYAVIGLAVAIRGAFAFQTGSMLLLYNSLAIGTLFLAFGLSLYCLKQWGDGDAWLLGAMGFLFPDPAGFAFSSSLPFPLVLVMNFFIVSLLYLVLYSIAIGVKGNIFPSFATHLRGQAKMVFFAFIFFSGLSAISIYYLSTFIPYAANIPYLLLPVPFLATAMLVFVIYGQYIEKNVFRKRIPSKDLRIGDVPVDGKWKVMTKGELARLRKTKKYVWIKEGVRFAPVFLLTLLFTLFYGSVFI